MSALRRSHLERDVETLEATLGALPPAMPSPALVVLSGLPGSGKSHLARDLRRRYPLAHVESDVLRGALFGRPMYTPQESSRLFAACHALVDSLLARGIPVVLDATNLREVHREPLYGIAERRAARLILVQTKAPTRLAKQRLVAKMGGADPSNRSEADIEVYEMMRREAEPIGRHHIVVDTSGNMARVVDRIVRELPEAIQ